MSSGDAMDAVKPTAGVYLRVALPGLPGASLLPPLRRRADALPEAVVELPDVTVDRDHLARYNRICGFTIGDDVPATYPHLLTFGAQLRLMASRDFPFPAMGLVHVANSITLHRQLEVSAPMTLRVRAADLRPHPKGQQVSLVSSASVDDELVWEDRSTYLHRGPGGDADAERPGPAPVDLPAGPVTWRLPADLGRRYAAVSGDRNPIHLNPLMAKAFGFPRAIAHGMWTAARALSAVQRRLPVGYRYDVAFGAPILLPSTVSLALNVDQARTGIDLAVTGRSGRTHLTGRIDEL